MAPDCSAAKISPPGRVTAAPPSASMTLPPKPGIRNFSPLISSTDLISLLNQPPACAEELPAMKAIRPNFADNSSQSCCPPR